MKTKNKLPVIYLKDRIKDTDYVYLKFDPVTKEHHLKLKGRNEIEIWLANKNHASYGLIYKNTHLEFGRFIW